MNAEETLQIYTSNERNILGVAAVEVLVPQFITCHMIEIILSYLILSHSLR